MHTDEKFMQKCLDLAKQGKGYVAPNPMVGSVVVHNGKIIGEGFHQNYGKAHAEVNAINAVEDKSLLSQSTIYINLEPCAHFGKTPPCADLIVKSKIPRVVIGCIDTYSEVAGKGIKRMMEAGIDVKVGVLDQESFTLNKRFFTYHTKKRPYVILKWAESSDGFMDIDRRNNEKGVFWITQPETKTLVHQWRHEEAGILVGKNTVRVDNPSLTCRAYEGNSPTRFVIDQKMQLDYGAFNIGNRKVPTYVLTEKEVISKGNLQFINPKNFSISAILESIYSVDIQSIIIEGGKTTLTHFIDSGEWDEARILIGENIISDGLTAPDVEGKTVREFEFGKDLVKIIEND